MSVHPFNYPLNKDFFFKKPLQFNLKLDMRLFTNDGAQRMVIRSD